jgi:lactoylglutathione lyase
MAIRKIEHVGIMVKDLQASIAFYQNVLGFDLLDQFAASPAVSLAFLGNKENGQVYVELVSREGAAFPDEGKVNHLAFTVDDIKEEIDRLIELKVTFSSEEPLTLGNGSKYIFFKGPDGESLELFQPASS